MLHREIYRGVVVWNRSKKRDQWGRKVYAERPTGDWMRYEQPELRIIEEGLWNAVQERLDGAKQTYLRTNRGQLWGRPASGVESKYLLTSMLACGLCGGSLVVMSRPTKHRANYVYVCSNNRFRGSAVCANNLWMPMETADRGILDVIGQDLLTPEIVRAALAQALETMRATGTDDRRAALEAERAKLDQEITRLTEAIAEGGDLNPLLAAMKVRDQRRTAVLSELATLDRVAAMGTAELGQLQDILMAQLADWQGLLRATPIQGRQILRKLILGRTTFTPRLDERYYEFHGEATLGRLLAGALGGARAVVAPTGFEPVFQP
jgi:site-specific DNA recombinase